MLIRLITISLLVTLIGCAPYPRYRQGGAERPPEAPQTKKSGLTTDQNLRLGKVIRSYLGKPYKGKSKYEKGVDCSLFTREVFADYRRLQLPRTVKEQFKSGREVHRKHLRFGDLVFFRTERDRVSHVGIYVGNNEFA
ncbi:MAG: C40 family peptidase, partial [candidate division Zixibacteria bacterium]|nr:C40 family peptidase [candidate division Zixibacteria bacterium]